LLLFFRKEDLPVTPLTRAGPRRVQNSVTAEYPAGTIQNGVIAMFSLKSTLAAASIAVMACSSALHAQTFTFTTLDNPGDPTFNQLLGINDNGVISGYFGSGMQGHPNIGYTIAPPYTSYTPFMQPGSIQTQATGINNAGMITGFWSSTNFGTGDTNYGLLSQPTGNSATFLSVTDPLVGTVPTTDQALGVNNNNIAVGFYVDANGVSHGFTYKIGSAEYTPVKIKGSTSVAATGINDGNEICGSFMNTKGNTVGFVSNQSGSVVTKFTVPGTKFTQLLGLNNEGVAVGFYYDSNMIPHGLYYTPSNGNWLAVNDPDGTQGTVVNGINNKGELVGFYTDAAGNTHGMVVTVSQ
jgi:hypothetical protein